MTLVRLFYSITNGFNCIPFTTNCMGCKARDIASKTRRKNTSNMIVSLASRNTVLRIELCLLLSIAYAVFYPFTHLVDNSVLKLDQLQMSKLIMYVFIDVYSSYAC